ncbi:uncharacterized protein LOC135840476 isoform X1 [Planococcus citri]|uniref:uncharacterized protein LOC135840476 isoform X1 n=1 Tax=Planococcus citri TaxID=170843 RepID=UPI0031F74732
MLTFLVFYSLFKISSTENLFTEIIPGSFISEIENIVVYEKSIPYKFILNYTFLNSNPTNSSYEYPPNTNCEMKDECTYTHDFYKALTRLDSFIDNQLQQTRFDAKILNEHSRRKRSFLLGKLYGNFLEFCCDVVTKDDLYPLFVNQQELTANYKNLKEALIETHADIFNISTELKSFSKLIHANIEMITQTIDTLSTTLEKFADLFAADRSTYPVLISILEKTFYNSFFSSIIEHCKEHKLPSSIISPESLKYYIEVLKTNIEKFNYTIAIPTSEILEYYTRSITHCQISEQQILLEIRVPLKKINSDWKLFKYTPIYFRNKEELCILNTEQMLIAFDSGKQIIREITGTALKKCDLSRQLCFLDYFDSTYESPECAKSLILGKQLQELNTVCNFKCEHMHSKTIIRKIQENIYIISNPQKFLFLHNSSKSDTIPLEINYNQSGAIKIQLPCDFELLLKTDEETQILIPQGFPCIKTSENTLHLNRLLPLQWTKLDNSKIDFHPFSPLKFKNITKIFNENWKEQTPSFNIKENPQIFENKLRDIILNDIQTPLYGGHTISSIIFTIWLIVLSVLILKKYC